MLFIDEIHRLPPAVEEFIYPAMEDYRVDITLAEGLNARTISLDLRNSTTGESDGRRFNLMGTITGGEADEK